jgi:hypothetical protein
MLGMLAEGCGLAQLLGDPGIGRVACDADMHYAACGRVHHEEGMDRAEEEVGNR